ncbi:DNA-directed RNA polymerase subunit K [Candidatus Woesearchaeota archaeon]|nr:DNA-directed RNA polymerase subunit K [Candidatus Woesearchaeota archaeon]
MNDEKYTKYEKARMLGSRSLQIAMGAPFLVKLSKKDLEDMKFDSLEIAKLEFETGVIPITVKRPVPQVDHPEEEAKAA